MNEHENTPFEQAYFDYRESSYKIVEINKEISYHERWIAENREKLNAAFSKRGAAVSVLKKYVTPGALEELFVSEKSAVTP